MSEIYTILMICFKKTIDEHEDTPSLKVWETIDKNLDKKRLFRFSKNIIN